jgi:hypothetical protein
LNNYIGPDRRERGKTLLEDLKELSRRRSSDLASLLMEDPEHTAARKKIAELENEIKDGLPAELRPLVNQLSDAYTELMLIEDSGIYDFGIADGMEYEREKSA